MERMCDDCGRRVAEEYYAARELHLCPGCYFEIVSMDNHEREISAEAAARRDDHLCFDRQAD